MESGDDETAEGGTGMRVRGGVTFSGLEIGGIACFPVGTESGILEDAAGFADTRTKILTHGRLGFGGRTFERMSDAVSVGLTITGAEIDAFAANNRA